MAENNHEKIILPLLITRDMLVFPSRKDERIDAARSFSKAAIEASRDTGSSLLFITSQLDPETENPQKDDIFDIATLCRIVSFSDNGDYYRVRVSGTNRFKLTSVGLDNNGGYYVAEGYPLDDVYGDEEERKALVRNIVKTFSNDPTIWKDVPKSVTNSIMSMNYEASELGDILATYLPMRRELRREILGQVNVNERLKLVLSAMNERKQEEEIDLKIQRDVASSAEKAQRDYILREKLKAIKQELGEDNMGDSEEDIKEKLENNPYPEHVKRKVLKELQRYDMMPQASLEASLIKSYIDTLMEVPWYQKTEDNDSIENVQKILDEDHYGLVNVKKRIVEYLAVKQMTGNLKAPILCFYGPPGCGKTSLAKSIARALGRKFFKASLGGISDEAEIRGHRRTYVGSMPGRIISGMRRSGVINPVFLLDEVDKLASSYKGDPSSALLEVLDPEQNIAFNDNYLEEPYDLSNVLFIATANYLENVPAPLRDRLELIEVPSYTELEKIQIAKEFLVKKQLLANGLKEEQVSFEDEAIKCIIEKYTREAGVRELERKLASIMRKICVEILTNKDVKNIVVTASDVEKYLGIAIFENSKKEVNDQVGVVTGLAYTEYGGDILPIEVNYFPGKGQLILTGKLGDVMKESASIALDYIRANADKYHIDSQIFEKNDIHIHVPEGAVPKDGPSAGVAITTAIISCLTHQSVDNNVAMTGEVTLRGHALPIGGLREKSLAALRSGIKTIIVPRDNKKNVDELPEEVKNSLKIVFMDNVDDAVKVAIRQ